MGNKEKYLPLIIEVILVLFLHPIVYTINDVYKLELKVFMYKHSINDIPVAFNDYFSRRSDIHEYSTRQVNNLNTTKNKKWFSDRRIQMASFLWDSLSKDIRNSSSVKCFRQNNYEIVLISVY